MAERRRSTRKKESNAGCLLWLAALVVVLLLFLLNWGKIQATLERTNFHEVIRKSKGEDKKPPAPPAPQAKPAADDTSAQEDQPSEKPVARPSAAPKDGASASGAPARGTETPQGAVPAPKTPGDAAKTTPQGTAPASQTKAPGGGATSQPERQPTAQPRPETKPTAPVAAARPPRTRSASLFFIRIDDDGVIVRQEVKRSLPVSDSPLHDSLNALLKGPTEDELGRKLVSLIPSGTLLLGVQVRGSTAFVDLSEAFMYNHYGVEGFAGQLKQIVYTATAFPSVQDVQILIKGQRRDYLGGEGVFIGKPLSRNSF